MALNRGLVNPLSVLGKRKLSFIPSHFSKIVIEDTFLDVAEIEDWINYNLNSRFAIIQSQKLNEKRKIIQTIEIGIEDSKELIILNLGCQFLHKGKF